MIFSIINTRSSNFIWTRTAACRATTLSGASRTRSNLLLRLDTMERSEAKRFLKLFFSYPLVLTGKSETITKSLQRYAKTGAFIFKLYSQLPWEENSVVQKVNKFHCSAALKVRRMSKDEMKEKVDRIFDNLNAKDCVQTDRLDQVRPILRLLGHC